MDTIEERTLDKSKWGDGPWRDEPDKKQWPDKATGLPCLANRSNPRLGNWCGYVGVPPGHPWHGKDYREIEASVHGGLTYAAACDPNEHICHKPGPGEPDHVWWLGFDCGHAFDLAPGLALSFGFFADSTYRDLAYVEEQCAALAAQIKEAA